MNEKSQKIHEILKKSYLKEIMQQTLNSLNMKKLHNMEDVLLMENTCEKQKSEEKFFSEIFWLNLSKDENKVISEDNSFNIDDFISSE